MSEPPAERAGLAPAAARDWIALQQALAFFPERVAPALRAGRAPSALLSSGDGRAMGDGRGRLVAGASEATAAAVARYERLRARIVPLPDASYPEALRVVEDAPAVLAVRGDPTVLAREAIAIVGARAATRQARAFARILAHDLARAGLVIVSGLARGIDAEAHRGALEGGGLTIAVLACGVDRIYPPEHRRLAEEVMQSGAVVSELPLGTLPRPLHFPLRNRIISGLSRAVVVVEARRRSGSLITVRHALNQGREVFVVPGAVEGPYAAGTNQLLREGARAIQSARDLLEDLGFERTTAGPRSQRGRSARTRVLPAAPPGEGSVGRSQAMGSSDSRGVEAQLEALLADGPRTADELLLELPIDPGRVATALLELELAGRIAAERDGRLHLCGAVTRRAGARPSLPCAPSTDARRDRLRPGGGASATPSASGGSIDGDRPVERVPSDRSKQEIPP